MGVGVGNPPIHAYNHKNEKRTVRVGTLTLSLIPTYAASDVGDSLRLTRDGCIRICIECVHAGRYIHKYIHTVVD